MCSKTSSCSSPTDSDSSLGDGQGALTLTQTLLLPADVDAVLAGDLDDDGDSDLLLPSYSTGDFLLYSNESGTFAGPTVTMRGFAPAITRLVDLNQDGRLDVLALGLMTSGGGWKAQVLLRTGPSTFAPLASVPITAAPTRVQIDDLDGNGTPDLLLDANSPQVVYTSITGQLSPSTTFASSLAAR